VESAVSDLDTPLDQKNHAGNLPYHCSFGLSFIFESWVALCFLLTTLTHLRDYKKAIGPRATTKPKLQTQEIIFNFIYLAGNNRAGLV
jgi:hypothetical protein